MKERGWLEHKKRVLHVAPEYNLSKVLKKAYGSNYIRTDISSPFADVWMDLTKLGFTDSLFDIVICNHVLEHILDDKKAMREIFRILKPRGIAILQVPYSIKITKNC